MTRTEFCQEGRWREGRRAWWPEPRSTGSALHAMKPARGPPCPEQREQGSWCGRRSCRGHSTQPVLETPCSFFLKWVRSVLEPLLTDVQLMGEQLSGWENGCGEHLCGERWGVCVWVSVHMCRCVMMHVCDAGGREGRKGDQMVVWWALISEPVRMRNGAAGPSLISCPGCLCLVPHSSRPSVL